jgi:hypothetical protein
MSILTTRADIVIGDGEKLDLRDAFGLALIYEPDNNVAPPMYPLTSITYAEDEEEYIINRTVYKPFDYKVKLSISTPNTNDDNANAKITAFNNALKSTNVNGVHTIRKVTLWNYRKRHKIVGYPTLISTAPTAVRDEDDLYVVEFTIRVAKPSLCDFDLKTDSMNSDSDRAQ